MIPPIVITAIINPDLFEARMQDANTLADLKNRIARKEIRFQLNVKDMIAVPLYTGDFKMKYITSKSDG